MRIFVIERRFSCSEVRGFEAMDRVAVKLEQDLAPMDEGNGEKQVKSRSMNQYGHVMR